MGKKKDERKRREREDLERVRDAAERAETLHAGKADRTEEHDSAERKHDHDKPHSDQKHRDHKSRDHRHGGAAPFAGIAATFVKQLETPLGRQIIAAGLMAAAGAIARQDTKTSTRPAPPTPSPSTPSTPETPPVAPVSSGESPDPTVASKPSPEQASGTFGGKTAEPPRSDAAALPPEMGKIIDSVAVGLGRLFTGFGKPTGGGAAGSGSSKDTPPEG